MNPKLASALRVLVPLYDAKHAAMPRSFSTEKPLPHKYRAACAALDTALTVCAADPDLRAVMVPWMLDFCGTDEPAWARDGRVPTPKEAAAAVFGDESDLAKRVHVWLSARRANVTDSGSGSGGWHFGAHCTDTQAHDLCVAARTHFAEDIEAKRLTLKLHFWGWHFRELDDDNIRAKFKVTN